MWSRNELSSLAGVSLYVGIITIYAERMKNCGSSQSEHRTSRLRKQGSFVNFGASWNQVNLKAFTEVAALAAPVPRDHYTAEWYSHSFPPCTTEPFTSVAKCSQSSLTQMYVRKPWPVSSSQVQHLPRDSEVQYNAAYTLTGTGVLWDTVLSCFNKTTNARAT